MKSYTKYLCLHSYPQGGGEALVVQSYQSFQRGSGAVRLDGGPVATSINPWPRGQPKEKGLLL